MQKYFFFSQWEQTGIGIISPGKKVVVSPALDTFKVELDGVLGHLYTVLLSSKVGPDDAWGSFQPGILWFCDYVLLQWNCWSRINLQSENTSRNSNPNTGNDHILKMQGEETSKVFSMYGGTFQLLIALLQNYRISDVGRSRAT